MGALVINEPEVDKPPPRRSAAQDALRILAIGPFFVVAFWIFSAWLTSRGISIP